MKRTQNINRRLESVFREMRTLENHEYELIVMNIELLKKKYFLPKFRKEERSLFEMSFRDFIDKDNEKDD